MSFEKTGLIEPIVRAAARQGYHSPTPIQSKCIPTILEGRDVIGCAQTGTGKTAAFAMPTLQRLGQRKSKSRQPVVRALVLAPTRELAIQIEKSFRNYGKFTPLKSTVVYGGVSQQPQVRVLKRGVDILVATPGRLLDLRQQKHVDLRKVEVLILDEADQMLDMGFLPDIKKIVAAIPQKRQTLMFSATMVNEVRELARKLLDDPRKVATSRVASPAKKVQQTVYDIPQNLKPELLVGLLNRRRGKKTLVFTRTKAGADRVARRLNQDDIPALAIHSDKTQKKRQQTLAAFKTRNPPVMVATDIAARGLDISKISFVINYDVPDQPEPYVHRIGRTGRAGESGTAITFCAPSERNRLKRIEQLIGKRIPRKPVPAQVSRRIDEKLAAKRANKEQEPRADRANQSADSKKGKVNWRTLKANKAKKKYYGKRAAVNASGEKMPSVELPKRQRKKKKRKQGSTARPTRKGKTKKTKEKRR